MSAMLPILESFTDLVRGKADLRHWRIKVCMVAGVGFSILAKASIADDTLGWAVCGILMLLGIVVGWRWNEGAE